jgi:urease accessory protein
MADGTDIRQAPAAGLDPRLAVWLSPAFPTGAFAYSHGLEWAAHRGLVRDRATLADWLGDLLVLGAVRNDMILLAHAAAATAGRRCGELAGLNELALALQPSAERHLETAQQGTSFLQAIAAAWSFPGLDELCAALGPDVAYPIAVGVAAAGHGIAAPAVQAAYGLAFVSNLVSAAIRLCVVGQTDGQRIIAALLPAVLRTAEATACASLDDLGGAALRSDIASLAHEIQTTRLFRS